MSYITFPYFLCYSSVEFQYIGEKTQINVIYHTNEIYFWKLHLSWFHRFDLLIHYFASSQSVCGSSVVVELEIQSVENVGQLNQFDIYCSSSIDFIDWWIVITYSHCLFRFLFICGVIIRSEWSVVTFYRRYANINLHIHDFWLTWMM